MSTLAVRTTVCILGAALALAACQPVDEFDDLTGPVGEDEPAADEPPGAPAGAAPATLAEALDAGEAAAARWQDGARLAEAVVDFDGQGRMAGGRLTYLAPDADRFLTVEFGPDGVREERTTLAAFELSPITAAGVEALPALPDGVAEPAALAEQAQEAGCDTTGPPVSVLYASGAPLAWDLDAQDWAAPLGWTATVTGENGGGVALDPVTGGVLGCVAAPPES